MRPAGRQRTYSRSHQRAAYIYLPCRYRRKGAREAEPWRSAAQRATGTIKQPDPCASTGHETPEMRSRRSEKDSGIHQSQGRAV